MVCVKIPYNIRGNGEIQIFPQYTLDIYSILYYNAIKLKENKTI